MPISITPEEAADAMKLGTSELKFPLSREDIQEDVQAKLFHVGIVSVSKFATFATDLTDFKSVLKSELELDPNASIGMRVAVAALCSAWKTATIRSDKVAESEGELEAKRMPKPLSNSDYLSMRGLWEKQWWRLEEVDSPARSYIEKRSEKKVES
jgi:hypothetical protein